MKVSSSIWCTGLVLAAMLLSCTLAAHAQAGQAATADQASATSVNIRNVTLLSTTFRTNVGPVTVACAPGFCENLGVFVTPSVVHIICPQATGGSCTFYVHLETQALVTANDSGIFQFLVDGVSPNPGPTDIRGFFAWDTADPNSNFMQARSYAVVAHVTNSKANQPHSIEAEFGCIDLTGDGCSSTMGLASMSIGLYKP